MAVLRVSRFHRCQARNRWTRNGRPNNLGRASALAVCEYRPMASFAPLCVSRRASRGRFVVGECAASVRDPRTHGSAPDVVGRAFCRLFSQRDREGRSPAVRTLPSRFVPPRRPAPPPSRKTNVADGGPIGLGRAFRSSASGWSLHKRRAHDERPAINPRGFDADHSLCVVSVR